MVHRDLKLENILIKYMDKEHKNYIVKLTDYGCSKRIKIRKTKRRKKKIFRANKNIINFSKKL